MFTGDKKHAIAIVGINQDTIDILSKACGRDDISIVKIINPQFENISEILHGPKPDIIVDTTNDPIITKELRKIRIPDVEVLSALSARMLLDASNKSNDDHMKMLLKSINEVRAAVRLAKNKEEILRLVLTLAIQATHADSGSIMLLDSKKRVLRVEVSYGLDETIVRSVEQKVGRGIAGTVAKTKVPMLTQGPADPNCTNSQEIRLDIVSSICSPLIYGEDMIGVLNISSKKPEVIFTDRDLAYVTRIASFTTEIIKTSKDYEETNTFSFELSLINSVRDILSLRFRLEERMNLLVMKIANSFNAVTCNFYEYSPETRSFPVKSTSVFNLNLVQGRLQRLSDYFSKQILETRTCVTHVVAEEKTEMNRWFVAQPIIVEDEIEGVLFIQFYSEKDSIEEECKLLARIADMTSQEMTKNREVQLTRVQALKMSAISEFSFDVATTTTFADLARKAISNACLILDAETAVFRLYNESMQALRVLDVVTSRMSPMDQNDEKLDALISRDTLEWDKALLVKDLDNSRYGMYKTPYHSALARAFRFNGKIIGTLTIYNRKGGQDMPVQFGEYDLEIFNAFCLQIDKTIAKILSIQMPEMSSAPHMKPKTYIKTSDLRIKFEPSFSGTEVS